MVHQFIANWTLYRLKNLFYFLYQLFNRLYLLKIPLNFTYIKLSYHFQEAMVLELFLCLVAFTDNSFIAVFIETFDIKKPFLQLLKSLCLLDLKFYGRIDFLFDHRLQKKLAFQYFSFTLNQFRISFIHNLFVNPSLQVLYWITFLVPLFFRCHIHALCFQILVLIHFILVACHSHQTLNLVHLMKRFFKNFNLDFVVVY